jgi:arylsulfatase A-like enzyme
MKISGFLLAAMAIALVLTSCAGDTGTSGVILIILDAVRADHLSCYGYERDTSPVLDSLAASGILFEKCQAQSPWTLPSCASIVSGLSVRSHGTVTRVRSTYRLDPDMHTIAGILAEEGYTTAGIVNNPLLSRTIGFADHTDYYSFYPQGDGRAAETVDEALQWLSSRSGQPYFLMVHFMDPHAPYDPPEPFDREYSSTGTSGGIAWEIDEDDPDRVLNPEDRDHLVDMYDGEIRWTDMQLGRLFAGIRGLELSDSLLIIVVADHGDEFLDHGGVDHGHTLYQELLHVPLIISGSGLPAGTVIEEPVAQFDILPTIMDYLDIHCPPEVQGISLLGEIPPDRELPSSGLRRNNLASILCGGYKIIGDMDTFEYVSYDLSRDPFELEPLPPDTDAVSSLEEYWVTPPFFVPPPVDNEEEVQRTLRDLGYIN